MGKGSNRIKLFKKVLREFLEEYEKISKSGLSVVIKIKNSLPLKEYVEDVNKHKEKFLACDTSILKNLRLLSSLNLTHQVNWEFLHNLYFIALEEPSKELLEHSKSSLAKSLPKSLSLPGLDLNAILGNSAIQDLIKDIVPMVTKSLEGKDMSKVKPEDILNGIMTNDMSKCGIDFTELIQHTTEKVNEKFTSGEISKEKLIN